MMTIMHYALGSSYLGEILMAGTDKGLCALYVGDNPHSLLNVLQQQFPETKLNHNKNYLPYDTVMRHIENPTTFNEILLDLQGTRFQRRVWEALQAIPVGTTVSYSDLAIRIGSPKATRAVARACATNQIAIVIPCHRVIRSNGHVSGYRWGVERKKALLAREIGSTDDYSQS